ncbi:MAG: cobalt-precorrin-5B (C(1))-methyltransferase, partial [Micromonosporaceae bacterium]
CAMALLPELADASFVEVGDFTGAALRQAARGRIGRIVFAGMAGKLSKLAGGVLMTHYTRSKVPVRLLADVTSAAGGTPELADAVEAANTARHAFELWQEAGIAHAAGRGLCRRTAEVLARFCEGLGGYAPRIEVIMVDFDGKRMIASFPEHVPGLGGMPGAGDPPGGG